PTRARVARQRLLALLHAAERRPQDDGDAGGWSVEGRPRAQVVRRGEQELGRPAVSPSLALELLDLAAEADAQVAHGEALDARNPVRPGDEPGPERVEVGADRRDGPRRDDGDRLSVHRLASPAAAARTATFTGSPRLRLALRPRDGLRLARPRARRATLRGAVSSTCERPGSRRARYRRPGSPRSAPRDDRR